MPPVTWIAADLDPLLAVVAATLDESGRLIEGNAGFLRLIGVQGPPPNRLHVARFFIQPDFAILVAAQSGAEGEIYCGLLTMGDRLGLTQSLRARVWREDSAVRMLAEYDIEDLERLNKTLLELNRDYANAQLELAQTHFKLKHLNAELEQHRNHLEALVQARTAELQAAISRSLEIQFAMDGVGISIHWVDLETGRILYVNRWAAAMLGYSVDEMCRLNVADIDPNVDAERLRPIHEALIQQGRVQFESVNRARDGHLIPVEVILYFSAGDAEMPAHTIAFLTDITQRKADELARLQAVEAAEAAQRAHEARLQLEAEAKMQSRKLEAMGTLAAGIAHDFNNILGSIVGFAEMTADDLADDSTAKSNVAQILSASFRARDLIARMLAFARQSPSEPVAVDMVVQVREALAMLRASLPPSMQLSFLSGMEDASATILADPTQIQQIVMNLCINAAHALDNHGIIRISLDPAGRIEGAPSTQRDGICLTVADSGSGIPPEVLQRMFDPFFTTKAPGDGSGLGLSVVYGIVTGLGGVIEVHSRSEGSDTGSEFRVYLPLVKNNMLQTGVMHGTHLAN